MTEWLVFLRFTFIENSNQPDHPGNVSMHLLMFY